MRSAGLALEAPEERSPVHSSRLLAAAEELYARVLPATLARLPAHPALLGEAAVALDSLLFSGLLPPAAAPQLAEALRVLLRLFQEAPLRSPGGHLRPKMRCSLPLPLVFTARPSAEHVRPELELPQAPR